MIHKTLTRLTLSLIVMLATLAAIELVLAQTPPDEAALRSTASYTYPGAAPCDTTLQACVNALSDGDRLTILPGEYTTSLTLDKAVSLIGADPLTPTILRAPIGQRVLSISGATIDNSVVISGLQIVGGDVAAGNKCPANCGGGIVIADGAWPTLNTLVISGNQATIGAGIFIDQTGQAKGPIMIVDTQIINNGATDSGGGLYIDKGNVTLAGESSIATNTAANSGGGVYLGKGTFTLNNGLIQDNHAMAADGGGLYIESAAATYTQLAGSFEQNTAAGSGGGVYVANNAVQLQGGRIFSNTALGGDGGGIYLDKGSLTWTGAIEVIGNQAMNGGGVYVNDASLQLLGGRIISNVASGNGGGLYASKASTISATRFLANSAGTGGGAYFAGSGAIDIVNSLFARNHANQAAAGLSLNSSGTSTLLHLTVADPVSNPREAIMVTAGTVNLKDTIITSHTIGISRTAGTLTADYNLYFGNVISQSGTTPSGSHDVIGLDPLFVDPTPGVDNYHLQLVSPAVDAGTDAGIAVDLDGQPRPIGHGFDIGAYELQADMVTISPEVGGQLNYASSTGTTTTVTLPPGLVLTPTTIVFNNLVDTDTFTNSLPPNVSLSGNVFELDAFVDNTQVKGVTFTLPVTIVVQYSDADTAGLLQSTLKLYRYEYAPYGDGWCAIGECRSTETQWLDINNHTLTARVMGFSRFGRAGAMAGYEVFLPLLVRNN
jgi:predicted outer membrane repeat protein